MRKIILYFTGTLAALTLQAQTCFLTPVSYFTGNGSVELVVADFNGDGKDDLATNNFLGSDISVLLGDGLGGFSAATNFPTGNNPLFLIVSDFNNDGKKDLAAANSGPGTISVFLGNGTGGFSAPINTSGYGDLTSADFDADGKMDLAIANYTAMSISILLGNGAGGFILSSTIPIGAACSEIINADFNTDGKADLAISSAGTNGINQLFVLLGNGVGGFSVPTGHATPDDPAHIISTDLNNDSKVDLVASCGESNFTDSLLVLLGNGTGGFNPPLRFLISTTQGGGPIAAADFNNDGIQDIATSMYGGSSLIALVFGSGNGSFGSPGFYQSGFSPAGIVAADFNGDGKKDMADADSSPLTVSVMLGTTFSNNGAALVSSTVITANQSGATYQWIDCANGNTPISGETSQTFSATADGSYAVAVTLYGCTVTSPCLSVNWFGIHEFTSSALNIYPNPTSGKIAIEEAYQDVEVFDLVGIKMQISEKNKIGTKELDISEFPKGIYFLKIRCRSGLYLEKIVLQ